MHLYFQRYKKRNKNIIFSEITWGLDVRNLHKYTLVVLWLGKQT